MYFKNKGPRTVLLLTPWPHATAVDALGRTVVVPDTEEEFRRMYTEFLPEDILLLKERISLNEYQDLVTLDHPEPATLGDVLSALLRVAVRANRENCRAFLRQAVRYLVAKYQDPTALAQEDIREAYLRLDWREDA